MSEDISKPVIDAGEVWRCGDTSLDVLITEHGKNQWKIKAVFDNGVVHSSGSRGKVLVALLQAGYAKRGECSGFSARAKQ